MSSQRHSLAAVARADHERRADAPVPPRFFAVARVVWVVAAILALGILFASIPGYLLAASQVDFVGHRIEAPAGLVQALDLAGALASFAAVLVCLGLAGLLFWRKPGNRMALFVSFYLLVYGIVYAGPLERLNALIPGSAWLATNVFQSLLFTWPIVALLALFPTGRFVPPWTRWVLLLAVASAPAQLLLFSPFQWQPIHPTPWLVSLAVTIFLLVVGATVYAQVFRYRHVSSPTERQQTKWAISGLVVWVLVNVVGGGPFLIIQSWPPSAALPLWVPVLVPFYSLSLDIVPLTLTVALLRYHLFDLDVLIRRTLVYSTLTTILGSIYIAGVLGAQGVAQALTGQQGQQPVFIVASTLLVAALFTPLRRRLQTVIDQHFYRRKYDAERTLTAFGATLRTEMDPAQLSEQLVAVVQETMQPDHISLWLRPLSTGSPGAALRPLEPSLAAWTTRRARTDSEESVEGKERAMPGLQVRRVLRSAGWSAYSSASLTILGIVFLVLFYALEAPRLVATRSEGPTFFGTLNDIAALLQYFFLLPLPVALYRLNSSLNQGLSWAAMALGIVGPLTAVIAQALLLAQVISLSVNLPLLLAAFTLIGVWMLLVNHLGHSGGALPPGLAWLGELTGAASLLLALGALALLIATGGPLQLVTATDLQTFAQQHPALVGTIIVLGVTMSVAIICGNLIWLIWLGRRLLAASTVPEHEASSSYWQMSP